MVNLFAIVALGFLLGMRHATDPDHVIAVTTIVSRERSLKQAGVIGAVWGFGHTLTILTVGAAMILFRVMLPPRLGLAMELAVGVMLIVLGLRNMGPLLGFAAEPKPAGEKAVAAVADSGFHLHGDYIHAHGHSHAHDPDKTPLGVFDRYCGRIGVYQVVRPLLVGIVHGLAGSAAIALLVLSTIQSFRWAVAYLLVFGIGTIVGMMLITITIATTFSFGQARFAGLQRHFGWVSGVVSVAFGLFIAYQIGFVNGLFTGNVHWIPR
ncbi:MAG: high-affinity nickel-transport family protein [Terriglobales bacterium]